MEGRKQEPSVAARGCSVRRRVLVTLFLFASAPTTASEFAGVSADRQVLLLGSPWIRHTIDDSSLGADGIRTGDINGDGHVDLVTGWEQGGVTRLCLNPGPLKSRQKWPSVTIGQVDSPEDALLADFDDDGRLDVVSVCEGKCQTIFFHWGPSNAGGLLDPTAWATTDLPASRHATQWMYCLAMQIDDRHGVDLIAGSRGPAAGIGWFQSPTDPRDMAAWQWHPIYRGRWIMSLVARDMDRDGDQDNEIDIDLSAEVVRKFGQRDN